MVGIGRLCVRPDPHHDPGSIADPAGPSAAAGLRSPHPPDPSRPCSRARIQARATRTRRSGRSPKGRCTRRSCRRRGSSADRATSAKSPPPPITERAGRRAARAPRPSGSPATGSGTRRGRTSSGSPAPGACPPPGRFWVNGYWKRDDKGWYRVPGFWSDRQTDRHRLPQGRPARRASRRDPGAGPRRRLLLRPRRLRARRRRRRLEARASGPRRSRAGRGSPPSGSASPRAGPTRTATGTAPSKTAAPSSPRPPVAPTRPGPDRLPAVTQISPQQLRPALRCARSAELLLRRLPRLLLRPRRPLLRLCRATATSASYYGYLDYP